MFLSIITPTFNRRHTLGICYQSLLNQTDDDFEWIIIDDGSTDGTEKLVNDFIAEKRLSISYFRQANGGKHRAHNVGVMQAQGELCVCLDSDDALAPMAVETAKLVWKGRKKTNAIGIFAKRGDFKEHKPICSSLPKNVYSSTMLDLQQKYNFSGDSVLFFSTELLQEHLFREFPGECFLPEDSLYVVLDDYGEMILVDQVLYYCEYLKDGLTSNYSSLLKNNPLGTSYCYYQRAIRSNTLKDKLHNMIISKAFLRISEQQSSYSMDKCRIIQMISNIISPIYITMRIKRKRA